MPDVAELQTEYGGNWGEHPKYPVEVWRYEVANNTTRRGYWEWVQAEMEAAGDNGDGD